ncbi:hypothetical protein N9V90_01990 [Endozoicomonas sp.]|nr:hypothetical protein [Endozoicomonas sp.]
MASIEEDLDILEQAEEIKSLADGVEKFQESFWSGLCSTASVVAGVSMVAGWLASSGATMNNLDPVRYNFLSNVNSTEFNGNDENLTLANPEVNQLFYQQLFTMGYFGSFLFRYLASLYNTPNNAAQIHNLTSDITDIKNLAQKATKKKDWRGTVCDLRNARIPLEMVSLGVSAYYGYLFTKPDFTQASRFASFIGVPVGFWGLGAGVSGACVWKGITDWYVYATVRVLILLWAKKNKKYLKSVGLEKLSQSELRLYAGRKIVEGTLGGVCIYCTLCTNLFYDWYRYQGALLAPQGSIKEMAADNNMTAQELIALSHQPDYQVPSIQAAEADFLKSLGDQATPEFFCLFQFAIIGGAVVGEKLINALLRCCSSQTCQLPDPDNAKTNWYVSVRSPSDGEKENGGCLSKVCCIHTNPAPDGFTPTDKRVALVSSGMLVFFIPFVGMYTSNLWNQDTQDALSVLQANPILAWASLVLPMFAGYGLSTARSLLSWEKYPGRQPLEHLQPDFQEGEELDEYELDPCLKEVVSDSTAGASDVYWKMLREKQGKPEDDTDVMQTAFKDANNEFKRQGTVLLKRMISDPDFKAEVSGYVRTQNYEDFSNLIQKVLAEPSE